MGIGPACTRAGNALYVFFGSTVQRLLFCAWLGIPFFQIRDSSRIMDCLVIATFGGIMKGESDSYRQIEKEMNKSHYIEQIDTSAIRRFDLETVFLA